jgi:hypothetical protein
VSDSLTPLRACGRGYFAAGAEAGQQSTKSSLSSFVGPFASPQSSPRAENRCGFPDAEIRRPAEQILLVSGDGDLRRLLRSFLEHAGFDVVCCADVDQCALVCSTGSDPDLLLVDLQSLGKEALELAFVLSAHRAGLADRDPPWRRPRPGASPIREAARLEACAKAIPRARFARRDLLSTRFGSGTHSNKHGICDTLSGPRNLLKSIEEVLRGKPRERLLFPGSGPEVKLLRVLSEFFRHF